MVLSSDDDPQDTLPGLTPPRAARPRPGWIDRYRESEPLSPALLESLTAAPDSAALLIVLRASLNNSHWSLGTVDPGRLRHVPGWSTTVLRAETGTFVLAVCSAPLAANYAPTTSPHRLSADASRALFRGRAALWFAADCASGELRATLASTRDRFTPSGYTVGSARADNASARLLVRGVLREPLSD